MRFQINGVRKGSDGPGAEIMTEVSHSFTAGDRQKNMGCVKKTADRPNEPVAQIPAAERLAAASPLPRRCPAGQINVERGRAKTQTPFFATEHHLHAVRDAAIDPPWFGTGGGLWRPS
jgi:hypothetical protein